MQIWAKAKLRLFDLSLGNEKNPSSWFSEVRHAVFVRLRAVSSGISSSDKRAECIMIPSYRLDAMVQCSIKISNLMKYVRFKACLFLELEPRTMSLKV